MRKTVEQVVNTAISGAQWFCYANPHMLKYPLYIRQQILDKLQELFPDQDPMDRMAECAGLAAPHVGGMEQIIKAGSWVACSEVLLQNPIRASWHLMLVDGRVYLSDVNILPYSGDVQSLQDGHRRGE